LRNSGNIFEFSVLKYIRNRPFSSRDKIFVDQCYWRNYTLLALRWTAWLESLRRGVGRLFTKSCRDQTPQSWELFRETQRVYRKGVQRDLEGLLFLHK
jgi:hypothetical protein